MGLVGGGRIPKPGEISLAHNGVLFLDELPEFNRNTLEVLRGPLEDRVVNIGRIYGSFSYPCKFMLIASMNPCPCGYYGSKEKICNCSQNQIKNYRGKISGPLLDRIDIQVMVPNVKYTDLDDIKEESSSVIRARVNKARKFQTERYKSDGIYSNSELTINLINKYCVLDRKSKKLFEDYFDKLKLSARSYTKILKVARTIADLEYCENIIHEHILEAIQISRNIELS